MPSQDRMKKLARQRSVTRVSDFHALIKHLPNRPRVVSEGDSWFDYPGYNLIDHIERKKRMNLLRLEKNGDEAVCMMSGRQLTRLGNVIRQNPVDLILFSGGGNDVVGEFRIEMVLKDQRPGMTWKQCIHHPRLNRKMDMIENAYRMLVDLVEQYSMNPNTLILTHNYDKAIPDGRPAGFLLGVLKHGPWIKPFMEARGITRHSDRQSILTYFLNETSRRLMKVQNDFPDRFKVVNTFGSLSSTPRHWDNELHPTKAGFKIVADKIWDEMQVHL